MNKPSIILSSDTTAEILDGAADIEIGQWYWVKDTDEKWNAERKEYDKTHFEWLGCVMSIGSNYVVLESPHSDRGYHSQRVHLNDFYEKLRFEPDSASVIRGYIQKHQAKLSSYLDEIKSITAKLGVSQGLSISDKTTDTAGTSLAVMSRHFDIKQYEANLKKAEKETLPALFESIKNENRELARWTGAETLPMLAQSKALNGVIGSIQDRVFNISLYAGLIEQIAQCRDGEAAGFHEKLHVMQRLLYMDEECLLNYEHGGMTFGSIGEFDSWLSRKDNLERILPFPRCMVAMRVRRNTKLRTWDGTIGGIIMNINEAQSDKWTFIFIRNGEKLYRLGCDTFEFDGLNGMIFPDKALFDPSEPMMLNSRAGSRIDEKDMMPVSCYEEMCKEQDKFDKNCDEWIAKNPFETWRLAHPENSTKNSSSMESMWDMANPFHRWKKPHGSFRRKEWEPFNDAFFAKCNASLNADSVVIGQELYWEKQEADKENRRVQNDWRDRMKHMVETHRPYGNPGPGYIARMSEFKPRAGKAVFVWYRKRLTHDDWGRKSPEIKTSITVPVAHLFNVSGYTPGEYKQFFKDPRTRAKYLQWAPMLLAAEEYHAGNLKVESTDGG